MSKDPRFVTVSKEIDVAILRLKQLKLAWRTYCTEPNKGRVGKEPDYQSVVVLLDDAIDTLYREMNEVCDPGPSIDHPRSPLDCPDYVPIKKTDDGPKARRINRGG